jgi:hypothetical protein
MLGMVELIDNVWLGLSELTGQAQELTRRQTLPSKNQYLGREERIPDQPEIRADLVGLCAEGAELSQPHPCVARSCFMS